MRIKGLADASALHPTALRDLLLGLAQAEFYDLFWSPSIIDEMRRNILAEEPRLKVEQLDCIISQMRELFPDADVLYYDEATAQGIIGNGQYRHVMAAAHFGSVDFIVTSKRDFPIADCAFLGIAVRTPDDVACRCLKDDPELVLQILIEQAARLQNPPRISAEVLGALKPQVPDFAREVGEHIGVIPWVKGSLIERLAEHWNLDEWNLGMRRPDSDL